MNDESSEARTNKLRKVLEAVPPSGSPVAGRMGHLVVRRRCGCEAAALYRMKGE
jgi:hypothetical protein